MYKSDRSKCFLKQDVVLCACVQLPASAMMQLCCISALLFSQVSRKWVNWFLKVVISPREDCSRAKVSLRSQCCFTILDLMHTQTQSKLFNDSDLELKNTTLLQGDSTFSRKFQLWEKKRYNKIRKDKRWLHQMYKLILKRRDKWEEEIWNLWEMLEFILNRSNKTRWDN